MLHIYTCGGTIDKVYFDALSEYIIGDSLIPDILESAQVQTPYTITELLRKDSLEMTDDDRQHLYTTIDTSDAEHILISHGTDTMSRSAEALRSVGNKTIVLFGAMQPARMHNSDAAFNLGAALVAAQTLSHGVYIVMHGHVFNAGNVHKNRAARRFE